VFDIFPYDLGAVFGGHRLAPRTLFRDRPVFGFAVMSAQPQVPGAQVNDRPLV
jgi:hypothetical protein